MLELPQILILLVIVLVIFGAKRLPEIARSLGSSTREFKKGISGEADDPQLPAGRTDDTVSHRQGDDRS